MQIVSMRKHRGESPQGRSGRTAGPALLVVVSAAVLAACTASDQRPLPPPVPLVDVQMTEYRFVHDAVFPGGRVILRVSNVGHVDHALTVIRMPDDFTEPVSSLFGGSERRAFDTLARVYTRAPGTTAVLAVDLKPARYGLISYQVDPDGVAQYSKGMISEFRVLANDHAIRRDVP